MIRESRWLSGHAPICPLHRPEQDLRHTRVAQECIEAVAVTLRQLNRRCGPLNQATTARIQALPLETLEALAEALLDFRGPSDLAAWLAEHGN